MINLIELLNECVDALLIPTWDYDHREEHLSFIEEALAMDATPCEIRELLRSAATIFRGQQKMDRLILALEDQMSAGQELVAEIKSKMGWPLPPFVYHGTIYGRLASISKDGLVPGKVPVWKDQHVPRQFADCGVYFASTWRGAMGWAECARMSSRGPRNGIHRSLVVIRLPASGLSLESDPLASSPGCLMVRGKVSVKDADVLHGKVHGFPTWRPLDDVLSSTR